MKNSYLKFLIYITFFAVSCSGTTNNPYMIPKETDQKKCLRNFHKEIEKILENLPFSSTLKNTSDLKLVLTIESDSLLINKRIVIKNSAKLRSFVDTNELYSRINRLEYSCLVKNYISTYGMSGKSFVAFNIVHQFRKEYFED